MNDLKTTDAISRSAAIEALNQHSYETSRDYDKTEELLNELPALDVAPVVRCADCKHRCTFVCPMFHTEYSWDTDDGCDCYDVDRTDDDGFCHLGERWECEEDAAD